MMRRTFALALEIIQTVSEIAHGPMPAACGVTMTKERAINGQAEKCV